MKIAKAIISDVAGIYGCSVEDLLSRKRDRLFADARTVICYVLYSLFGCSSPEIGRQINRTHASVLYFDKKAHDWLRTPRLNPRGANAIREIEKEYIN